MKRLSELIAAISIWLTAGPLARPWRLAKRLIVPAFWLAGIPAGAYWISQRALGHAYFIGPFLLVSPLIAIWLLATIFTKSEQKEREYLSDQGVSDLADGIFVGIGLKPWPVAVEREDPYDRDSPVDPRSGRVTVFLHSWKMLSEGEQKFALAQAILEGRRWHRFGQSKRWIFAFGLLCACVASTANLWLILPLHSFGLLFVAYWYTVSAKLATLSADRGALAYSRDLKTALNYIRATHTNLPWLKADARVAALRNAAAGIGLA